MKVCIIGVLPSSLTNFRGELIKSIVSLGHQVVAMGDKATESELADIHSLGVSYRNYSVQRNGMNPISDIKTLLSLIAIFKQEKPDIILAYTIKPVIWGGIASKFFPKIKFFGLITGLGFAFQRGGLKRNILNSLVTGLYRISLANSSKVIFQNPDNLNVFVHHKIIPKNKCYRVHGSGVNLDFFQYKPIDTPSPVFLTIARLLGEKGLREYANAAKIVKQKYPEAIFQLVGPEDPSPDGVPIEEVKKWHSAGYLDYLGETSDVRPFIEKCSIFVLASYHEGMPRTILEAMAIGRPILTTNVPGCKETVIDGKNGFLVEKANVCELVDRMIWFIENRKQWQCMAEQSARLAAEYYDVNKVNKDLLNIMELN